MCEHYGNYKSLYSTLVLSQSHIPYSVLECNSGGTTTVLDSFVLVSAMYPYAGYAHECSTSKVQQIFPLLFHSLTCTFTKTPCTTLHVCKLSTRLVSYLQYTHIHTHIHLVLALIIKSSNPVCGEIVLERKGKKTTLSQRNKENMCRHKLMSCTNAYTLHSFT